MRVERHASAQGRPTVLLSLAGLLLVARLGAEVHDTRHPVRTRDLIGWRAPADGSSDGDERPTLFLFTADWCIPCRELQRAVFMDPEAVALVRRSYVPIKVQDRRQEDGENNPIASALLKRYAVTSFPTLVVARPHGLPARLEGYQGRSTVLAFLREGATPAVTASGGHPAQGSRPVPGQ
jgi:thiol:disulfide interchange protein